MKSAHEQPKKEEPSLAKKRMNQNQNFMDQVRLATMRPGYRDGDVIDVRVYLYADESGGEFTSIRNDPSKRPRG